MSRQRHKPRKTLKPREQHTAADKRLWNNHPNKEMTVEYSEESLRLLEAFAKSSEKASSPVLDAVLANTAITGQTSYPWEFLKHYVAFKAEETLERFRANKGFKADEAGDSYLQRKAEFTRALHEFPEAPFTIQRLCEILLRPEARGYTQTNALLFAFEKMVSVTTVQRSLKPHEIAAYNSALGAVSPQQQKQQQHSAAVVVDAAEPMEVTQ